MEPQKHSALSHAIANTFETALSDEKNVHLNEVCVSSPVPGHPNYGLVVQGEQSRIGEQGFSVSLRQNFSEETLGDGGELLQAYASANGSYDGLINACDKLLDYFQQSLDIPAAPIHPEGPFGVYTKEVMQPLLDALNAGDFNLAAELTPANWKLCGYQEFATEHVHSQSGHGWAGQFEDTVVPPGRYPVFATNYGFNENLELYSNYLKDFQGINIFLAGKCTADSINRDPADYPYDNTVFVSPYCHAVSHAILEDHSSIHLIPPFQAEPVYFQYQGEDHTTYRIVDTSLPQYMKQNPMKLRNLSSYIRKTQGLSKAAKQLYDKFRRNYSYSLVFSSKFISLQALSQDERYSPEALNELLLRNKVQARDCEEPAYELTASERLDLFHSGQMHMAEKEPLRWRAEYDRCKEEYSKKGTFSDRIQAARTTEKEPIDDRILTAVSRASHSQTIHESKQKAVEPAFRER